MNCSFFYYFFYLLLLPLISFENVECKCGENSASGDDLSKSCRIEGNSFKLISSGNEKALIENLTERTVIIIKPDGVSRGLISECMRRFENRRFKLIAMKFVKPSILLLQKHYYEHLDAPFMQELAAHMQSGPIVVMIWEGKDIVAQARKIVGTTYPNEALPGTIRGDYGLDVIRNVIHASSSVDSCLHEIKVWFSGDDIISWNTDEVCKS